jgi:hypothetical protein
MSSRGGILEKSPFWKVGPSPLFLKNDWKGSLFVLHWKLSIIAYMVVAVGRKPDFFPEKTPFYRKQHLKEFGLWTATIKKKFQKADCAGQ